MFCTCCLYLYPHGFSITFSIFQIETDPSKQSTSRSFPEPVFQEEEGKKESNNQVIDVQGMLSYKVHSACLPAASLFIRQLRILRCIFPL
jgi:hypothetical protein